MVNLSEETRKGMQENAEQGHLANGGAARAKKRRREMIFLPSAPRILR